MFIEPISRYEATGLTAELYEQEEARWGFFPNLVQVFSHHPTAYQRWRDLIRDVYDGMDRRRCELVTLAAAVKLKSTCCAVAHGKGLRDEYFSSEQVARIARDQADAFLSELDTAILAFAQKVADAPSEVTQSDVDGLTNLGLDDREIFDVVLAVAARAFLVTIVESLGMMPESPFVDSLDPELRDALTAGRPIP